MRDYVLRRYSSLEDALDSYGIPLENRDFVREFVGKIGISDFFETTNYIKAVRKDGGPDMHISSGWSNGFRSEAEILSIFPNQKERWGDDERARVWGVWHPLNWSGRATGDSASKQRDYGTCPKCLMNFYPNGTCGC
jgi:hypothetical protein